jgi:xanthosine utilization system XapX-like protein
METIVLSIVFAVIIGFCYSLWKVAVNEEKKEIKKLFH